MLQLGGKKKGPDRILQWKERFRQNAARAGHPLLQAYYRAGVVDGETSLGDAPLAAMDFETTGLSPDKDAIVSIGLIPLTLKRINSSMSCYWVVNPGIPLKSGSVVIHGITHSEIRKSPDLTDILPELLKVMSGSVMVVHCRQIERGFLNAALKERWREGIEFPVIDTMDIEASFQRRGFKDWWAKIWGRKRRSVRLAASRDRYHLPVYSPHHALTDALATAELFQAQAAWHYTPQTLVRELWD